MILRKIWKKIKRLLYFLWLTNLIYTILLIWLNPLFTPNMIVSIFRNTSTEYHFRYKNVPYNEMGDAIKYAVIASEDQKFAEHFGFDMTQIKNAAGGKSKRIRGASTITQQTAKNLFYINKRSWIRKALEAYSTLLLEIFMSKKTILKHYLNIAEMGPNVYGIFAAAQYHFGKKPADLTQSEASYIAALLPSPVKRSTTEKKLARNKAKWINSQITYLRSDKAINKIVHGEK